MCVCVCVKNPKGKGPVFGENYYDKLRAAFVSSESLLCKLKPAESDASVVSPILMKALVSKNVKF